MKNQTLTPERKSEDDDDIYAAPHTLRGIEQATADAAFYKMNGKPVRKISGS